MGGHLIAGGVDHSARDKPSLAGTAHKLFPVGEDVAYQFRRGRLRIQSQKRLCSRSAEQQPCLCAVAVGWRIQEELHAVEMFLLSDAITVKRLRAFSTGALNR